MGLFQVSNTLPLDVFQIIVGIYLIEVIVITAILISKIEYGEDSLKAQEAIGNMLLTGLLIYFAVAFVTTLAFSGIARLAILVGGVI